MDKINLIMIDFEFTTIEKTNLLLISGAISNIYHKAPIIKLKGTPLILRRTNNTIAELDRSKTNLVIRNILRIFKNKEEKITPILNELNDSILTKTNNLNYKFIQSYCNFKDKTPVIITWNGHSDMEILKRLNINHTILSLTCYDTNNDSTFYLQIINIRNKQIISQTQIGKVDKNGRQLNLKETHDIICHENHNITYLHDPVTDVQLTRCIFHYLNNIQQIPIKNTINTQNSS